MVVCLVLGIMLAVQFKNTQNTEVNLRGARTDEVYVRLMEITEERDDLAKEVLSLREKMLNVSNDRDANRELQEEMQKANMAAGLLPLHGKGIVVTLNDSARTVQIGEDPNALLVHDVDILNVISELKASGAEAISVNEERIIAMSEVRCAGTTILVNTNKIAPPFIIKAIGDPQMLESGLSIKGGVAQKLKDYGLQLQIQKSDNVEIPAYTGIIKMKFSQLNKQ